jgi:curved DNA-binding protein CbpA
MNPYEVLDIPTDATAEDIKNAYRNKSKETHPDSGGSNDAFVIVNACYIILADPSKRKRYDETGSTEPEISFEKEFAGFIQGVFVPFISTLDVNHIDLVKELRKYVFHSEKELNKNINAEEITLKRVMNVKSRLKSKGDSIIHGVLDLQISQHNINIQSYHQNIGFLHKCQQVIEDYTYNIDEVPEELQQYFVTINLGGY